MASAPSSTSPPAPIGPSPDIDVQKGAANGKSPTERRPDSNGHPQQASKVHTHSLAAENGSHVDEDGVARALTSDRTSDKAYGTSALLTEASTGRVGLFAVFGGQGPSWLPELRSLYLSHEVVRPIVEKAASLAHEQAQNSEISSFYRPFGFNVMSWLQHEELAPGNTYLASAPVSCAMILLTQMLQYYVTCVEWRKSPAEARDLFKGATGHSQGLLGATLMSMASTEEELVNYILKTVPFMVWFGARLQQATPFSLDVREDVRAQAKQLGYPHPTPMLAILNLDVPRISKYIAMVNKTVPNQPTRHIQIGLKNAPSINVVVGHPETLLQLVTLLHRAELPPNSNLDQTRIPFSKRKKEFVCRFLSVSVPFHHTALFTSANVVDTILKDAAKLNFDLDPQRMAIPVYGSDGTPNTSSTSSPTGPIPLNQSSELLKTLILQQSVSIVDWLHACLPINITQGVTHLIDFGHGGIGGIGSLCARNMAGAGISIISAGSTEVKYSEPLTKSDHSAHRTIVIHDRSALFDSTPESLTFAQSWTAEFAPTLVMTNDGKPLLETRFTRALGKPPVMVAGMTPTTVNHQLVAASLNAGFHAELAGGGLPTEKMFRSRVEALVAEAHPGAGVTINLLFLNPSQWGMQFPLVLKMAKEGVPIEGITIGAGVPSLEKATEIIHSLRDAGLTHIGFKPGSVDAIHQVIAIAQANPQMTILLQWTGGRGGGHHSFEDFHQPILATYAHIRQLPNIVLIGGSGFGDTKDSWPYMNGSWSVAFGAPPMPFDAILVASRVMVALEAGTSTAAKELLVSTPGIESDAHWEQSYDGNAGGVMNVQSELGEPIHKVATKGVMLWRQFDKEIFSLPKDKIAAKIEERKRWIIEKLNAEFQKVYFGKKFDGTVCDLEDMTYEEVVFRMIELQYIYSQGGSGQVGRWIHDDFMHLVHEFLTRIEERFIGKKTQLTASMDELNGDAAAMKKTESRLGSLYDLKHNPHAYITRVIGFYPDATTQLLSAEDIDYFLALCRQRGRKPVNFVPVIDKDLAYWFKKDSLWQSEDIEAVPDGDVQRVVILQGPQAVRYSTRVNEPVADILNGIHSGWVKIQLESTNGDISKLPVAENLVILKEHTHPASALPSPPIISEVELHETIATIKGADSKELQQKTLRLTLPSDVSTLLQRNEEYLSWLASLSSSSWWNSTLSSRFVTQDRRRYPNLIAALFTPRSGQIIDLSFEPSVTTTASPSLVEVQIREPHALPHFPTDEPIVALKYSSKDSTLSLTLNHVRPEPRTPVIPLELTYRYVPQLGHACLHELTEGKNERVKQFYSKLWFDGLSNDVRNASPLQAVFKNDYEFTRENIVLFCQSIGRSVSTCPNTNKVEAPLDMAIVAGWESVIKSLFLNAIDADILQLVHLSNSFKRLSNLLLLEGDKVETTIRISEIANTPTGQRVSVEGHLSLKETEQKVVGLKSQFFFRSSTPLASAMRRLSEEKVLALSKKETLAILKSKSWISWKSGFDVNQLNVGDRLVFRLESSEIPIVEPASPLTSSTSSIATPPSASLNNITTRGTIYKQAPHAKSSSVVDGEEVGSFSSDQDGVAGCVIRGFLQRFAVNLEHPVFFPNSGYQMIAPDRIVVPVENNTYAAASGDLNPIHTNPYFAILTRLPATITHGMWTSANARRVIETFAAKTQAGRVLDFTTEFVGMVKPGDALITRVKHVGMKNGRLLVEIRTECEQTGEVVLKGTADVVGSRTAYVFTGQGSAEVNMGMDLYASSNVAKRIWDAADVYFMNRYGFSILNIVRTNPKEIEIFFGGKAGEMMRHNYQQLTQQVQLKDEATGKLTTKQMPLFPQITEKTWSYTFKHPDGLLFATQFSQPALVLVELAAFSDIQEKGIIPNDCIFAGHSLGEYAALASVASVLSTENLVDIVFLRGMTMQNAVVRDEAGRSPYAMVAVNTGRVHPTLFREPQLNQVIEAIVKARPELLQVVNYNVDNYQYVVAGERGNLSALGFVLSVLNKKMTGPGAQAFLSKIAGASTKPSSSDAPTSTTPSSGSIADMPEMKALLEQAITHALESRDPFTGAIPLERGMATIPLPGIDVPFHSRFLSDGVPPFRHILQQRMSSRILNKDLLIGRYVPNVTAAPFSLEKAYIETVQAATQSSILTEVLSNYETEIKNPQLLAFTLLVELLAYQFASPVRWIETQHLFFSKLNVERFIEIGPAPTLFGMAKRTLETGQFSPLVSREVLWYGRDRANIYFQNSDVEVEEPAVESVTPTPAPTPVAVVAAPAAPVVVAVAAPAAAAVPDSPPNPLEFIQALVALRLKKPVSNVAPTETIKAIVSGKSALQNELLGDLETEFGTKMPDGASDASLATLAQQMGANYKQLGKIGTTMTHKLVSNKMPGGFGMSQVKAYLNKSFGLGDGKSQSVLLHATSMEPASRLSSEAEAHAFLDSAVAAYGSRTGQTFSAASAALSPSPTAVSFAHSAPASSPASIPDEPIRAVDALRIMTSLKVKKSLEQVPATVTIKDLVGGKSALQNELVGDIQKEFGSEPGEGATEMDLATLASRMGANYSRPGPYLSAAINKLVSTKMPGGYGMSSVRSYLNGRFGLGEGRVDSVLAHALALEPERRLTSETEAHAYLDQVTQDYASKHGVSLSSGAGASASSGPRGVVDSAALKAFEQRYNALIKEHMRVYHEYLGQDPLASDRMTKMQEELRKQVESQLLVWQAEHGSEDYFEGIKPVFDTKKERRYNSSWNWTRQDCLQLYYDYACGRATEWTKAIRERLYHVKNRATPSVVDMVEYYLKKSMDDGHGEIKAFLQLLADTLRFVMDDAPKFREHRPPMQPSVHVGENGSVQYKEVPRVGAKDMEAYVHEMARGPQVGKIRALLQAEAQQNNKIGSPSTPQIAGTPDQHVKEMQTALKQLNEALTFLLAQKAPEAVTSGLTHQISKLKEALDKATLETSTVSPPATSPRGSPPSLHGLLPFLFLRKASKFDPSHRSYDETLTMKYLTTLMKSASEGVALTGKVALVIGCGKGSIGVEIVKALLHGGAKVYATTSRFSDNSSAFYHKLFDRNGAKGSELVVLPFNQGSVQDVHALVKYVYDVEKSDLDYIVPFAALPENGRDIGDIDGRSELAHRIMLTNVLRLIGAIKEKKRALSIVTRPAHVLLPMSPNHGIFGFDGLYAESKLGLEALLNKWHSEGWKQYLSLAGAIIGWTRGTGLMNQNNVVAAGIEAMGARTFTAHEMGFNLMGLLHPDMVELAQNEPVLADLNGCLHLVKDLNIVVSDLRKSLVEEAALKKAVAADRTLDKEIEIGKRTNPLMPLSLNSVTRRANITVPFPEIPSRKTLEEYKKAEGMVSLENVVVIAGFGEVGPHGSSRTRWEMESYGEFSVEGCIELAWMMGLIKYHPEGGWQDVKTGERCRDDAIKAKYESVILQHTGIRLIEPELFGGYDPHNKMFLHQVALNSDMAPLEVSAEEARAFKQRHGDVADVYQDDSNTDGASNSDAWYVRLKKGAVLYIPKAIKFDRFVAGQVPSTWDPSILGIPQDIINQVDRVTLFSLVSTVEALVSAGVTDPYEFYQYVHLSELGNTVGGGFGGMESVRRMYRNRLLELPAQGDILQESFINTVGAWLNMLLLSSSGPIKTPVGACATAVESVEIAVDTIKSGKAKVVIVGGYDDFGEEGSYEFANMKATASAADEIAKGRAPREMSRPATSSRGGFVESQGAGTQILMTAALAVQMGIPIYGIVEHVSTATDKVGRSVPAPGQGILTTARENGNAWRAASSVAAQSSGFASPLLDIEYRRKHLEMELRMIDQWAAFEISQLASSEDLGAPSAPADDLRAHIAFETARRKRVAFSTWGNDFYRNNPSIAPLRGALAVYGLTIDDIAVASFHGTGTKGNDLNESQVVQKQLEHLGRSTGNVILTIFQKYLTGHPKGAAAAWMLNGMVQSMMSGIVPGNRNADNIDPKLRDCSHVVYLNRSLHTYGFKAGLLKSFGFGQVGGEVLVIHPNYVLAQLNELELRQYVEKREARRNLAYRHWQNAVTGKANFVALKDHPPYSPEDESRVYLDPLARATYDAKQRTWVFPATKATRRGSTTTAPNAGSQEILSAPAASSGTSVSGHGPLPAGSRSDSTGSRTSQSGSSSVSHGYSPQAAHRRAQGNTSLGPGFGGALGSGFSHPSPNTSLPASSSSSTGLKRNLSATTLSHMEVMMREMGEGLRTTIDRGIGVDAQSIDEIDACVSNTDFVARNFTVAEIAYCRASPDPSSSFAGRWAAKEAVIKAISSCDSDNNNSRSLWQGAGAPLKDIEILPSGSGAPIVQLSGHAANVASLLSISTIKVAISHSGDYAIAQAIAR